LVFDSDCYCEKCGNKYEDYSYNWCKQCQINQLKNNFTSWTSGNERIDDFIQKMQLKINGYNDVIFEWIPYKELIEIKEINEDYGFVTAIWKNGHSFYNYNKKELTRKSYEKVILKFLYDLQDFTDEFLNMVFKFSINLVF
jgi:hypothetical protein